MPAVQNTGFALRINPPLGWLAKYLLDAMGRLLRRATLVIGEADISLHPEPLQLHGEFASFSAFYRMYHGKCSEELLNLILPFPILHRSTLAGLPFAVCIAY